MKVCVFVLVWLNHDVLGLFCFCILQGLSGKWLFFAQFLLCFELFSLNKTCIVWRAVYRFVLVRDEKSYFVPQSPKKSLDDHVAIN